MEETVYFLYVDVEGAGAELHTISDNFSEEVEALRYLVWQHTDNYIKQTKADEAQQEKIRNDAQNVIQGYSRYPDVVFLNYRYYHKLQTYSEFLLENEF